VLPLRGLRHPASIEVGGRDNVRDDFKLMLRKNRWRELPMRATCPDCAQPWSNPCRTRSCPGNTVPRRMERDERRALEGETKRYS